MKKITPFILATIFMCSLPLTASSKITTIMMTSGFENSDDNTPKRAVVVVGFNDNSEYQAEVPVITNQNSALKGTHYAVIDLKRVPAEFQQKFKDAVSPLSDYILVSKSGERRGDIDGITGSATGTPGNLSWSNFIGSYPAEGSNNDMPGAKRRTNLCLGSCQEK